MNEYLGYTNGYIEKKSKGTYEGILNIDGIDISPIEGVYFKKDGNQYLWIKRKDLLEYDNERMVYFKRQRKPYWETYLTKQSKGTINYKGEFFFLHIRYSIVGIWDAIFKQEKQRLNLFVERLPMKEQTIINRIYERNNNEK